MEHIDVGKLVKAQARKREERRRGGWCGGAGRSPPRPATAATIDVCRSGRERASARVGDAGPPHHRQPPPPPVSQGLHDGHDAAADALILDEDKVVDALEPMLAAGGAGVDHHGSDFFPERFFDLILVLTTDTATLWDRLAARGYAEAKVRENVQCEIMRVCADEAIAAYPAAAVTVAPSDTVEDMEANVDAAVEWAGAWSKREGG